MKFGMKLVTLVGTVAAAGAIAATPMAAFASDGDVDAAVFVGATGAGTTPILLVGGSGVYNFNSTVCVGVSSDVEAGACVIASAGAYVNIVCGTGSAAGAAAVTEPDGSVDNNGYAILFVAGIGVVTGGADGVVVLQATGPGSDGVTCTSSFEVEGVAVTM